MKRFYLVAAVLFALLGTSQAWSADNVIVQVLAEAINNDPYDTDTARMRNALMNRLWQDREIIATSDAKLVGFTQGGMNTFDQLYFEVPKAKAKAFAEHFSDWSKKGHARVGEKMPKAATQSEFLPSSNRKVFISGSADVARNTSATQLENDLKAHLPQGAKISNIAVKNGEARVLLEVDETNLFQLAQKLSGQNTIDFWGIDTKGSCFGAMKGLFP